jgi:geranylgeranyl diphosphate synthase, type II
MIRSMSDIATSKQRPAPLNIKTVPAEDAERQRIRAAATEAAAALDRRKPPIPAEIEKAACDLMRRLRLAPSSLGFTMVSVNNEFWRGQFAAVPPSRRLLLLPHCLRHVKECKGSYDARGLACAECGACTLAGLKAEAESLGYTVLIAEGSPAVVEIVLRGQADAILGMACLDSLEKVFARVAALGIPHVAVPLLTDGCVATTAEIGVLRDWLRQQSAPAEAGTRSYVPLLRAAERLFEDRALEELVAGLVVSSAANSPREMSPAQGTETLALEWLREGGKRLRPFIMLAGHGAASRDARLGGQAGAPDADAAEAGNFPLAVRRVALAIEALHKASLIHDDIEDGDEFRYGRETLHRRHGVATALNVGDYLIGLGYRLVTAGRSELGAECVADILAHLSEAHTQLCRGQGEELLWTRGDPMAVRPEAVQRIYALKTAPAFEAALYSGVRTAQRDGMDAARTESLRRFSRFVGVAYQLLNDLKDWTADRRDKLVAGQDSLARRPTMLLALALEAGDAATIRKLASVTEPDMARDLKLESLRKVYEERGAFDQARKLVEKYRERARAEADAVRDEALRDLMHFLVEAVL